MGLIQKIVKQKRLQKLSGSVVMIIPELWVREKGWTRQTQFTMEFRPASDQIIITANEKKLGFKETMTHKSGEKDGECKECKGEGCERCSAEHLDGEETSELVSTAD